MARVLQVSRQALYRVPARRPAAAGPPAAVPDEVEQAIVEVAEANQTDGYRMVTALVRRRLGQAVNRCRHAVTHRRIRLCYSENDDSSRRH